MRRNRIGAAAAAAIVAIAIATTALPSSAGPTSDPATAAQLGAGWLARQVGSDGSVPGGFGACGSSPDVALALAAARVGSGAFDRIVSALEAGAGACAGSGASASPGALGKLILVAVAAGDDPTEFGGTGAGNDLVARLLATKRVGPDPDAGLFGEQDPTFDGAFRQSFALLALNAAGATAPADAVDWLEGQQCPDGGWQAYRAPGSDCDPTDLVGFKGEDTNSTAIAAQALAALGVSDALPHDPLDFLDAAQDSDGGFGFFTGQQTDANSTGLVNQAIVALGEDPSAGRWANPGGSATSALLALQVGCAAPAADRGGFAFQAQSNGVLAPDIFATAQAVPGAAHRPFPLTAPTLSAAEPVLDCSGGGGGGGGGGGTTTVAPPSTPTSRLAGEDRYATAAAVSQATFPSGAPVAYVTSGQTFADGLVAGAAAGTAGGPVLLVERGRVPDATAAELRRLKPARVIVVGGTDAVSSETEAALVAVSGVPVSRVAGRDRYETAAALTEGTASGVAEVIVTTGASFPDALSAASTGAPVLLTARDALPDATRVALERLRPAHVSVVGGTAAVSDAVEDALVALATVDVSRVAGADRYATAAALATSGRTSSPAVVFVTSGEAFPDALAAAPAVVGADAPLLLVRADCTPAATRAALRSLTPQRLVVVGGTAAVTNAALTTDC